MAPQAWDDTSESWFQAPDTRERVEMTLAALPPQQRAVISLRDVGGWKAEEVAYVLGISAAQQCVLLHQARSVLRGVLELFLDKGESGICDLAI
jgi:DNA-directed RNA polymerase specialized sigma24 family protein